MAYKNELDSRALIAQWKAGEFRRVYLLAGPDALTKEEAFSALRAAYLGPGGEINMDLFDGQDASAGEILAAVNTLPFFGGRRLIAVRRAHALSTAELNRLSDGLAEIPESNVLLLLWDEKADARLVIVQAARSAGAVATFWPPFENQLPQWVSDRGEVKGKQVDRIAAQALVEAIGPNLSDLAQELDKLILYVGARSSVTQEDVAALSGGGRTGFHFMEWERALWKRDRLKSLRLLESNRTQGEAPEALFAQLIRAFQRLLMGKALLAEKVGRQEVLERLWIRLRNAQDDFSEGVDRWSWDDLSKALDRLLAADVAVKTGRTTADPELTRLVTALTEEEVAPRRR